LGYYPLKGGGAVKKGAVTLKKGGTTKNIGVQIIKKEEGEHRVKTRNRYRVWHVENFKRNCA
jgi:hypothetical protein